MSQEDGSGILIDGFGLSEYRSFGVEPCRIGPAEKINLLIGQNNSGKSNLLAFLSEQYATAVQSARDGRTTFKFSELDRHVGQSSGRLIVELGLRIDGATYHSLTRKYGDRAYIHRRVLDSIGRVLRSRALTGGTEIAWFRYQARWGAALSVAPSLREEIRSENVLSDHEWRDLWSAVTESSGGDIDKHWIPETLKRLSPAQLDPPGIALVSGVRQVGDPASKATGWSGQGLIRRLAELQNPDVYRQDDKARFEEINAFLREVIANPTARFEIPHDRSTILVEMDGKVLPLSSLGTGVHEVIILAAAATLLENQIVCIEEPEIHLHPIMQKKLLRYLQERTSNQYFISTHSGSLVDVPGTAVFHVRLKDAESKVEPAFTHAEKARICADLGYRASDLLQTNCVIWVEGPSDRVYLNHWIAACDPELTEGIHYSVMFCGGSSMKYLSGEEEESEDLILLRRLNRNMVIVMDSDRAQAGEALGEAKERLRSEFDDAPGFAWITQGRTIENYVDPAILEAAVKKAYRKAVKVPHKGSYDNCLWYEDENRQLNKNANKIRVAREVVNSPANLDVLDLREMVTKLVNFIRDSNGLTAMKLNR